MRLTQVPEQDVYDATLTLLTRDIDGNIERLLQETIQWEEQNPPESPEALSYWGFEWFDVHGDSRTLNKLVTRRVLSVVFKSNKSTTYRTANREAIKRAIKDYNGSLITEEPSQEIPPDLFDIIVGHDEKKFLIKRSLDSPKTVHFLLWGVVASAKTLLLEELGRLPNSHLVLGSSLTKAGLFEVLFLERPRYLILDELDKIDDPQNLTGLLSLMERGLLTETKYRRHRSLRLKTWVFASANNINKIPQELMSRFLKLRFHKYTDTEFTDVVVNVLRDREGISESLALYISQKVMRELGSKDVRDTIKIARLLKEKSKQETDHIIQILKRQT